MSQKNYMSGQTNKEITDGLTRVLADTFAIYFKTHSFHWNVEGPLFQSLHELFGQQYTALWEVADDIAERIRALQVYAPKNYKSLMDVTAIEEETTVPKAETMCSILADDHGKAVTRMYEVLRRAEDAGDEATVDMLIGRINEHEKFAWMLRSIAFGE